MTYVYNKEVGETSRDGEEDETWKKEKPSGQGRKDSKDVNTGRKGYRKRKRDRENGQVLNVMLVLLRMEKPSIL